MRPLSSTILAVGLSLLTAVPAFAYMADDDDRLSRRQLLQNAWETNRVKHGPDAMGSRMRRPADPASGLGHLIIRRSRRYMIQNAVPLRPDRSERGIGDNARGIHRNIQQESVLPPSVVETGRRPHLSRRNLWQQVKMQRKAQR